ncbi:hypothetical protein [Lacibacter sp. H407]|uniref:hypothetical protein n=1 Tax=Lacibacter sp. H407 TaxID=3133423 RepID=UPI0030BA853C
MEHLHMKWFYTSGNFIRNPFMRLLYILLFSICCFVSFGQNVTTETFQNDSLVVVSKNPEKGFYNDYILFIPKGTPVNKKLYLLVEPNNTGKITDSIEIHKQYAIDLASVSSVGNNISTELKLPLLVPIFPRPASKPLVYTHALDRDVMLEKTPELKRLDLQLLQMIKDARSILTGLNILTDPKIFMSGFSASATFTNRFSFLHPEKIKALAIGGFNGKLMLPQTELNGIKLNYPVGTNDFFELYGQTFDIEKYRSIPQYIYMGKLDDNDAVQFDDAYNFTERKLINENIGRYVQDRYLACQRIYLQNKISPVFKTYDDVGHWTTSNMNLDVIKFFLRQMQEK